MSPCGVPIVDSVDGVGVDGHLRRLWHGFILAPPAPRVAPCPPSATARPAGPWPRSIRPWPGWSPGTARCARPGARRWPAGSRTWPNPSPTSSSTAGPRPPSGGASGPFSSPERSTRPRWPTPPPRTCGPPACPAPRRPPSGRPGRATSLDGRLELDRLGRLPDDQVSAQLVQVRGIGPWTAHMFLIFSLGRLDVVAHG